MKRAVLWLAAAALAIALTVLAFLPAAWLAALVENRTGGRLTLGDAQGTLWRGSAFLGGAPGAGGTVMPLLPGRFVWRLSPLLLFGQVSLQLENPLALTEPVNLDGSWSQWQVSPSALKLPAEGLAGLGAPLNTLAPSGTMRLAWSTMQLRRAGPVLELNGHAVLSMTDMGSRMTQVNPLGSYELTMDWRGLQAQLNLATLHGALLLSGAGVLDGGRLRFSGQASAAAGQEEMLGNLLNLLGQRRMVNGKNMIALEFK